MTKDQLISFKKLVKKYDPHLFVKTDTMGGIHVFQKGLLSEHWVLSLTEDWQPNSPPCEWGFLPVIERLNFISADRFMDDYEELKKRREDKERVKKRSDHNEMMAMASEMRPLIRDAFKDINTASMNKVDARTKEDRKYANTKP